MEESTLRWPIDKEREEMEEVCSIGGGTNYSQRKLLSGRSAVELQSNGSRTVLVDDV